MFKKLVANLPFNPSLINQVGFYSDRLRQERSVRRLSFVFMALAMAVQSLAVISPPEKSLAYSNNHIINGVQTRDDILSAYDNNLDGVREIYERFYISRADLAALTQKPNSTIRSNDGNNYRTIGRNSLWNYSKVNSTYKKTEVQIQYRGLDTPSTSDDAVVYNRELKAWDIKNPYNSYSAFKGKNSATGKTFWILVDCGNITWIPPYGEPPTPTPTPTPTPPPITPEPKKPELEIKKTVVENYPTLKPGDTYTYRVEYRNKVVDSVAENVIIRDELDVKNFDVVSIDSIFKNFTSPSGVVSVEVGDLKGSETFKSVHIKVRLKNPLPSGTKVCNAARIEASNTVPSTSNNVCSNVVTPCPYDSSVPSDNNPNCVQPVVVCSVVDSVLNLTTREVTYKTTITSSNPATTDIYGYNYDFGDGSNVLTKEAQGLMDTATHTYKPGKYEAKVTIVYGIDGVVGKQQAECLAEVNFEEDKPLGQSKTVSNITRELEGEEAIKSKVGGGEVLEYTLSTVNSQNYDRTGIEVADYIGDILDYAELDIKALEESGGIYDKELDKVIWSGLTIKANSQLDLKFRVKMSDPIPATNQPSATSGDYDCVIDNTYGNTISMSVQCPAVKGLETLPNTGPGASLLIGTGITGLAGYFFARSRLLARELDIIRTDFVATGGM